MRRRGARRTARRAARRTTRRTIRRTHRRFRRRRILVGGFTLLMVGGAAAAGYGAYKLSQRDIQQIETHTGKNAEDLTEEELNAAMDQLGIETHELTAQDEAAIDAESIPGEQNSAPQSGSEDYISELEKLSELANKGIITQEEFEAKKKQLLGL